MGGNPLQMLCTDIAGVFGDFGGLAT